MPKERRDSIRWWRVLSVTRGGGIADVAVDSDGNNDGAIEGIAEGTKEIEGLRDG